MAATHTGEFMSRRIDPPTQLLLRDNGGPLAAQEDGLLSERELVGLAISLGAREVPNWSDAEERLANHAPKISVPTVGRFRNSILNGQDPLGDAFCQTRSPLERRESGATFTPDAIVNAMVDWAAESGEPRRIVDPGSGSGRYLVAAAKRFPNAQLIGVETDAVPAMLSRANLAVLGLSKRSQVTLTDYRTLELPRVAGKTLFIGNPPYVRHHRLGAQWKQWLTDEAAKRGLIASQLAGLHVHFFIATAAKAIPGDFGAFITAAEWLDVNYGSIVREMFLDGLGGKRIVVVEPTALPFPDAATTAAITYFEVGARPAKIKLKRVGSTDELKKPNGNHIVCRERLESERRWSPLTRPARKGPAGYIELGELCRVHRGQVTGLNKLWIEGPHSEGLPDSLLFRTVTKAQELFRAGRVLADASTLRRVIDLPVDLDELESPIRRVVDRFLAKGKQLGAHLGYVAVNRKAWWSVRLRDPAPILTTYMARRPPAFVRNEAGARHINIAHGIYPREALPDRVLKSLIDYLSNSVCVTAGRTYAGGLTKFEPREMERLLVPGLEVLSAGPAK
jgi:adenine-specific DNA-methyltransferase